MRCSGLVQHGPTSFDLRAI